MPVFEMTQGDVFELTRLDMTIRGLRRAIGNGCVWLRNEYKTAVASRDAILSRYA